MLQTLSSQQPTLYEDRGQALDLGHYLAIVKRRFFYFVIPFVFVLMIGLLVTAIQRPIFQAEGKILVESPEIPTNLVQPTVTGSSNERMEVIQQRLMTRDNLLSIVKKFGLFSPEQQWMSGTELLDLMRERTEIQLVDVETLLTVSKNKDKDKNSARARPNQNPNKNNSAIAFTLSFEYENPELAMKVANEFLTLILKEDVQARTNRATETTQFLARETKRLQAQLDSVNAQISEIRRQPGTQEGPEQLKSQMEALTKLKADLIHATSVYSDAHPAVKALKKRIAALEQEIAGTPKLKSARAEGDTAIDATTIDILEQQRTSIERNLDDAGKKLTAARLGESMERDQQGEHLQVIEQPSVPQTPIKPKKIKFYAISLGLATIVGGGVALLAEVLNKAIRSSRELAGVVDSHLVVAIPYISTPSELRQRKRKVILLWSILAFISLIGIAAALFIGIEIDVSWVNSSLIDSLTRLSK
jgi:uncharacterized protein involved in exopolysaccharide biosynthesis